jgi:hypothetical protein
LPLAFQICHQESDIDSIDAIAVINIPLAKAAVRGTYALEIRDKISDVHAIEQAATIGIAAGVVMAISGEDVNRIANQVNIEKEEPGSVGHIGLLGKIY